MRILLNITEEELAFVGGDQKYYRTLLASKDNYPESQCTILKHSSTRLRTGVRQLEAVASHVSESSFRQRLFAQARRMPIFPGDLDVDIIFSTVLAARPLLKRNIAQVWYSQGISPASYYEDTGKFSITDVAALYWLIAPHVSQIVVGTHDGTQRLQEMCPNLPCPITTIPQVTFVNSHIDLKSKLMEEKVHFLFVGQDYKRKGLPEVLSAYRRICRNNTSCELHIVTAKNCPLQKEAADLPDVFWHFNLFEEELEDLYCHCNVLLATTYADTYNLVIVEAMAFGLAIISSNLAPLREIAPHDEVGLCVEPGDVDALALALDAMIEDTSRKRRYMRNSFERYESIHAPDVLMPQLLDVFKQAIS